MDSPPPGGSGGGETTAAVVLALHLVWVALEAATDALLPLWMLSPGEEGSGPWRTVGGERGCISCAEFFRGRITR